MDKTQAAQSTLAQGVFAKLRNNQPFFIANDYILNNTLSVDKNTDLAANFGGEFYKAGCQFMGTEFRWLNTAAIESLQRADLTLF